MLILLFFIGMILAVPGWLLLTVSYYFILKKMPLKKWTCIIPFLAEREFSTILFPSMRTFYRPLIVSFIFIAGAIYLGPDESLGSAYSAIACVIYGLFLARLYWRLAKSFGKGVLFRILTILFPFPFLLILGLGKAKYSPLPMRKPHKAPLLISILAKVAVVLISIAEIVGLTAIVLFFAIRKNPPEILVQQMHYETSQKIKDIKGDGSVKTREEMLGDNISVLKEITPSRDYFYKDTANAKNVVVFTYIIGSNLENRNALASANIEQMIAATKKGDGLTFVLEAGGSKRWFTNGIDNRSYGRYVINGGRLAKLMDLPEDTCMSEGQNLTDFIVWGTKNFPADRYMLVLWDHGGGVASGYGQDDVNIRKTENGGNTMASSEFINALQEADTKFELLGFDACLMQDLEIAAAVEPYADYYLASEEVEGGYGWYYTTPFGALAENPGLSIEDFSVELLSAYDILNTRLKDGEKDVMMTLSLVDTTLAKPAYERLEEFFLKAIEAVKTDSSAYASLAVAGGKAYTFHDNLQIDLLDFLRIARETDTDGALKVTDKEIEDLENAIRASILFRNSNSAEGINGMAFALPYKAMYTYDMTREQLSKMALNSEKDSFDILFSIMAAQKKKAMESKEASGNSLIESLQEAQTGSSENAMNDLITLLTDMDYTTEDWYVEGFENYDDADVLVDIPLKELSDGYQIELPAKMWKIMTDCKTVLYQKVTDDQKGTYMRYLGTDYVGNEDPDGHPMIAVDGTWVHINGQPVCYKAGVPLVTEEGTVFTGTVRARLNNAEDITIHIEWDPLKEGEESPKSGKVVGYDTNVTSIFSGFLDSKGMLKFKAGDRIHFIFDTNYEASGETVTEPSGQVIPVTGQEHLTVEDKPLKEGTFVFGGVLTDVYQRTMTTELLEATE